MTDRGGEMASGPVLTIEAMVRSESRYACTECGRQTLTWTGRCPGCGEWNTLDDHAAAPRRGGRRRGSGADAPRSIPLRDVEPPDVARLGTGIGELDRVLGGGIVPGSLILLGGSPGIGKSTVAAMALGNLAAAGRRTLYVSGEESAAQVRLRAERLGEHALAVPVIAETRLAAVIAALEAERPEVCIVDSVQTLHADEASGAPGSVSQVRESAAALMEAGKRHGVAVLVVGHVTKDGSLAGPRALEHLVDCVLLFEGERERSYRTLRALKNRFGATSEVAVFEMRSGGLTEVTDPSARFVGEATAAPGSCVLCAMEGTRPLLVEVQALVAPTEIVPPRRIATGIDRNRLSLVLAVLARHAGVSLSGADVFVNVAGGVRVDEPGADLAVALALASAHRGAPLVDGSGRPRACFGEVGLTGELRHVAHPERRVAEALKFGLGSVIGPPASEAIEGLDPQPALDRALKSAFAAPVRKAA
jgi:DNA repair protein RadA/Sms